MNHRSLTRFAWLAVAAAIATIMLKAGASLLTSSVGLLSDTLESFVNLASALIALAMLTVAARPADNDHPYGHGKAEYFSSILEGALILVAAGAIGITAVQRLMHPRPLEQIGLGLAISVVAALLNLAVGRVLLRAGRRYRSVTLEANAQHLLTDVWTSVGVLVGVGAAGLTGWLPLDPILALVVAGNIVATGVRLVRRSVSGLMDAALPPEDQQALLAELARYADLGVQFHALRTRQAGARRFVSLHVLVPGDWTVQRGHKLLEDVETGIRTVLPNATVFTHLEPSDDPASWEDVGLDRGTSDDVSRV